MKSPLDERPRLNKRGSKLALLFFVLCFFEKHCVASLQLKGSLSISSASILSSSGSLKDCYLSIRSTTFLSSPALLRADFLDESTSLPSIHLPSRNSMITMAKGDGKQKRKKQTPSSSPAPALPAQPNAPRVSTDINISIRRQIAYGKLNKQMRAGGATSFRQAKKVRTKFRKTWNETEIAQKAEERKRKGQDPDWDVILNRTSTSPLIVSNLFCPSRQIFGRSGPSHLHAFTIASLYFRL